MSLLDRYLLAVKKYLPWKRQDDILAELKANLESQLEEKEGDLGRPLTRDEMQDWVKHLGPPMVMAARYQPQQYLIGPTIFPMYWWVLQLACGWCLIIYSVVKTVEIITHAATGRAIVNAVLGAPWALLVTAAWVTVIFAAIELATTHSWMKLPADVVGRVDWSPGGLPTAEEAGCEGKRPRSHAHAVAEVVFGCLSLVWLLLIPSHPYLLMGPGAAYLRVSPYELAPVWIMVFWWIVALNVVQLGWRCIDLARGAWQNSRAMQHMVVKTFGLVATVVLFTARDRVWIVLKHPIVDAARYGPQVSSMNHGIYTALVWVVAISAAIWLWQVGQFGVEWYRRRAIAA